MNTATTSTASTFSVKDFLKSFMLTELFKGMALTGRYAFRRKPVAQGTQGLTRCQMGFAGVKQPAPDAVFLGGTTGAAEAIVELLRGLQRPIRLVATAVTMESAQALLRLMRPMVDFEARQVAVSALESVGRYTMFKAENPVFIFSANVT